MVIIILFLLVVWFYMKKNNEEAERLAAFIGIMSNTAFNQHISAQGRDRLASLEAGIGQF